ncbi:MAG: hypothetical protein J2P55_01120 [Rhizobiales bacterium]|nr:hypothetical protein [Hyphomicrobiales bacterium]
MKQLRTVRQVFEVLGGVAGVAKITGANWKQAWFWLGKTNRFPANTYVAIQRALAKEGYEARPSLFAMKGLNRRAA